MRVSEIILELNTLDQILISPGSLFYGKRMLSPDAEEIIVEQATMGAPNSHIHLKIHLQKDEISRKDEITAAIHRHFTYRRKKSERQIRKVVQLGLRGLLTSFVFFGLLVVLTLLIVKLWPEGRLSLTFREILIILGWVALWRPADLLLYEWRPFKREVNLFRKLEQCMVEILARKV